MRDLAWESGVEWEEGPPPNLVEGCKALVVLGNVCHHRALIRLDAVDHVWAHRNKHAHKVEEEEEEEEGGGRVRNN